MVLGSSALTTGTKVVRAMTGTAIGVVLGAALIEMVGVQPAVLWTLMPIAIFAAAYVPRVASFTAGQAVLTMMVMIAYNLIVPTGWRAGLLRIEDVGAGAVVAVIAAVLLWPRGATASVYGVIGEAVSTASQYLQASVRRVPGALPRRPTTSSLRSDTTRWRHHGSWMTLCAIIFRRSARVPIWGRRWCTLPTAPFDSESWQR